jgi:PAS domain S-box-containing protein
VADRVYYSRRWKQILGYDEHELGDSPQEWSSRVHPDDLPQVLEKLELHLKDNVPVYQSEHRIRHKSGRYLWVFERGRVVQRNEQGRALRIVGTYSDITRLKEAEKALRDKQAAELASRSKTEFLSRMSHEMRTPLNAMIGFSQLLKLGATSAQPSPSQVRHYADHMLQAGQHLLALINDVLDLQRVEAGQLAITIEPISLQRTVEQALELLEPLALASAVTFDNRIDEDVLVLADAQRLRQVLINIISNAIKYNRVDGLVRLSLGDRQGDAIDILIEDTGEGLRRDQLARLFQPFERLGRETSPIEGTGLGLIIAKRLIDEMHGSIEVTSEPGTGTCVTLMVRLAHQALPAAAPEVAIARERTEAPGTREQVRMLYVEDNPINALLFEEAMKLTGHIDLMIAEDGPQAFEIVRDWRPDILVLDAHLPGMTGFEVLEQLRNAHGLRDVPAFMCSADAMPEDIQRALDAGFLGYWTKPIEVKKVIAEVDQVAPRPVRIA